MAACVNEGFDKIVPDCIAVETLEDARNPNTISANNSGSRAHKYIYLRYNETLLYKVYRNYE
jgi:hypothetical protein